MCDYWKEILANADYIALLLLLNGSVKNSVIQLVVARKFYIEG